MNGPHKTPNKRRKQKTPQRILLAGGGSGGHVFPLASLIEYRDTRAFPVRLYRGGRGDSLEQRTAASYKDVTFLSTASGKRRRESPIASRLKNIRDIFLVLGGSVRALFLLWYHHIDTVFCKGGYAALPWVFAAIIARKRLVVHESDTRPGLVNKLAARFADKVFVGFKGSLSDGQEVGQILSDRLLVGAQQRQQQPQTRVLVNGGSLGARMLYLAIQRIISTYKLSHIHFDILFGGNTELADVKKKLAQYDNVTVHGMIDQEHMGSLMAHADIAVTRAGTTSLAEQDLFGCKLLIVPLIVSHDQYTNAMYYVKNKDALLIKQQEALRLSDTFVKNLGEILETYGDYKKDWTPQRLTDDFCESKAIIWEYLMSS